MSNPDLRSLRDAFGARNGHFDTIPDALQALAHRPRVRLVVVDHQHSH